MCILLFAPFYSLLTNTNKEEQTAIGQSQCRHQGIGFLLLMKKEEAEMTNTPASLTWPCQTWPSLEQAALPSHPVWPGLHQALPEPLSNVLPA